MLARRQSFNLQNKSAISRMNSHKVRSLVGWMSTYANSLLLEPDSTLFGDFALALWMLSADTKLH